MLEIGSCLLRHLYGYRIWGTYRYIGADRVYPYIGCDGYICIIIGTQINDDRKHVP